MKKFLIKFLALTLCFTLCFSFACGNANNGGNGGGTTDQGQLGVHQLNMESTDKFLVKDGKTDYTLVLPANGTDKITTAKNEFVYLFNKATGITISAITDEGLSHNPEAKYISIGETSLFTSSGFSIDRTELTLDGYQIFTKDNTVYLIGGGDYGTIYSVYTFFEMTFNYDTYSGNCVQIETDITEKPLYNYAVKDVPDIYMRTRFYTKVLDANENLATRLRLHSERNDNYVPMFKYLIMNEDGTDVAEYGQDIKYFDKNGNNVQTSAGLGHSVLTICNPIQYLDRNDPENYHPKWYSASDAEISSDFGGGSFTPKQICFTAHGDAEEYQKLVELVALKVKMGLKYKTSAEAPYANYVSVSCEDNVSYCKCSSCKSIIDRHGGAIATTTILLLNDVIPIVEEWMDRTENAAHKRDLHYCFYAYDGMEDAPAVYNEQTGKYEPINGLYINPKIAPRCAIANGLDYQQPLFAEINEGGVKITESWSDICDEYYHYTYMQNYNEYIYMYDCFPFINNETFKYYKSVDTKMWYLESVEHDYALTGWNQLKLYINTKMLWNCNLDVNDLIDNYFNAMFMDAAPIMRDIFNSMRVYYAKIAEEQEFYRLRSNYRSMHKQEYWTISIIETWLDMFNQALKVIEKYKDVDVELYTMLHYNIAQEMVQPAFIKMDVYANDLNIIDYKQSTKLLEDLVNEVGIKNISQYDRADDCAMLTFIEKLKNDRT